MQVLFGGTFDPIHQGHVAVALAVAEQLSAPVTLVPNAQPPHKMGTGTSAQHRLAMLQRAIAPFSNLGVTDWELHQSTPSWTINTLKHWRSQFPHEPLVWVVGEDSLSNFHRWHRWQEFAELCHLAVLPRANATPPAPNVDATFPLASASELQRRPCGLRAHLSMELHPVSSTQIRQQLAKEHHSTDLPPTVMHYIREHGLYGVPTA